jgi:hypothetical protein
VLVTVTTAAPASPEPLLAVNNIEVVYDHVILVLRGVSWSSSGADRRATRCERRQED